MTPKIITVIATIQARPGKEAELKQVLLGLIAPTRKEKGCINYDLHISPEDPAKFLFFETWTSQATLDAHLQSPHLQSLLPRVEELCAAFPEIKIWEKIN